MLVHYGVRDFAIWRKDDHHTARLKPHIRMKFRSFEMNIDELASVNAPRSMQFDLCDEIAFKLIRSTRRTQAP